MKIIFITSSYFPHYGGLETVVNEIATGIRKQDHQIMIIANRYPRNLRAQEEIDEIPIIRLLFLYPTFDHIKNKRFDLWLASLLVFPLTFIRLFLAVHQFRPDIVNVHYPNHQNLFVWLLSYLVSFRLITSLHGGDVEDEPYKSSFKMWLFLRILKRSDRITTCSKSLLNKVVALEPKFQSKLVAVLNGVHTDLFFNAVPYRYPKRYILGVGKLEYHKGFDVLINAFIAMAHQIPDVSVLIAGDGSQKEILTNLVNKQKLEARVSFLGRMTSMEVASLMKGATVIVIPSRREGFGIVAVEAMAAGCAIVSSQAGGLGEALDGAVVRWMQVDDVMGLADILTELLTSSPSAENYESNRRLAAGKDWTSVTNQYLAAYN